MMFGLQTFCDGAAKRVFGVLCLVTGFMIAGQSAAAVSDVEFKCTFDEECGSLKETACYEPGRGFLLTYGETDGFVAVMLGEVWLSQKIKSDYTLDGITTLAFTPPSGEVAFLTVDQDWKFVFSNHFTGLGDGMDWHSGTGTCEMQT